MMPKCAGVHTVTTPPMRLTRCFVPAALAGQSQLVLPEGPSTHIARVLRLRAGAALTLFDGRGGEFEATVLAVEKRGVRVQLGAHHTIERESSVALTLLQCVIRAERMDFIVQKATELGVAAIVPVQSRHGVVRLDEPAMERRQRHWQAVAIGACEQCGRNRIPQLRAPVSYEVACAGSAAGVEGPGAHARVLLDPTGSRSLAQALESSPLKPLTAVSMLIGPEGGFGEDEIALARDHGFQICSLGPRVLRAETAPIAALAVVQVLLGDFAARHAAMN
jgi:16S rRNA (uracil1498-N3)-methyltransferase